MNHQKIRGLIQANRDLLKTYAGTPVNEQRLLEISRFFCKLLGMSEKFLAVIYRSSIHLLSTTPDATTIQETFRKLAANDGYLWRNMTIPPWEGTPIRVTVGVISASEYNHNGKTMTQIYYRVLTGLPAGLLFDFKAPSWWFRRLLQRKLGLWHSKHPLSGADISGCTFNVALYRDSTQRLAWKKITALTTQKQHNKELIDARYSKDRCGVQYPCCKCKSTREQCPLAVL